MLDGYVAGLRGRSDMRITMWQPRPDFAHVHTPRRISADAGGAAAAPAAVATRGLVGRTVAEVERDLILVTLDHCLGNRTRAAGILGISIRTLRNKLGEYASAGIDVPQSQCDRKQDRDKAAERL
jgi:DNA-binding NtrC family response regulator